MQRDTADNDRPEPQTTLMKEQLLLLLLLQDATQAAAAAAFATTSTETKFSLMSSSIGTALRT